MFPTLIMVRFLDVSTSVRVRSDKNKKVMKLKVCQRLIMINAFFWDTQHQINAKFPIKIWKKNFKKLIFRGFINSFCLSIYVSICHLSIFLYICLFVYLYVSICHLSISYISVFLFIYIYVSICHLSISLYMCLFV